MISTINQVRHYNHLGNISLSYGFIHRIIKTWPKYTIKHFQLVDTVKIEIKSQKYIFTDYWYNGLDGTTILNNKSSYLLKRNVK